MTEPAITCRPTDSLNEAARLMWDHDVGSICVVQDDGHVSGIITDRDICMAAYTSGGSLPGMRVSEHMSTNVITCRADESVQNAMEKMRHARVRRLPITDSDGRVTGVLSLNDLAREARRQIGQRRADVSVSDLTETFAETCEPRSSSSHFHTTAA